MNRICIPNSNVFTNALKDAMTTFLNASNSGTFGNFINDLTNVKYIYQYRTGLGFWLHLDLLLFCHLFGCML